ncbi:TPA: hypothetical protein QDB28_002067 [Burkholderia vietnamiensis]|uniref:hypothetical protein n=1 Tax=Burkholderia vietnamiensis TaxID=60552 RepID=UPI00158BB114|nr:hypothetical protein [Burkholderia vietnamiensis]HDR9161702.1 hypothetical protein [Burkholderia vietnamiensis]
MTTTSSGALGGGLSGATYGNAALGDATMGGWPVALMRMMGKSVQDGQRAYSAVNAMEPQQGAAPTPAPAQYRRGGGNQMQIPMPLPAMASPSASFAAMPGAGALPTTTSSYQNLLTNMLGNSMQPPTAGLVGSGLSPNFMPGAGGPMNPGCIIPGMY